VHGGFHLANTIIIFQHSVLFACLKSFGFLNFFLLTFFYTYMCIKYRKEY